MMQQTPNTMMWQVVEVLWREIRQGKGNCFGLGGQEKNTAEEMFDQRLEWEREWV